MLSGKIVGRLDDAPSADTSVMGCHPGNLTPDGTFTRPEMEAVPSVTAGGATEAVIVGRGVGVGVGVAVTEGVGEGEVPAEGETLAAGVLLEGDGVGDDVVGRGTAEDASAADAESAGVPAKDVVMTAAIAIGLSQRFIRERKLRAM